MIDWFEKLTVTNQIAIIVAGIAAGSGIIVAIINGLFSVLSKKKNDKSSKYTINQTAHGHATQIGVQVNHEKEGE